jgi:hypothetical protein
MKIQETYKQKTMAAQLKEWNAQIDLFETQLGNAGADMSRLQPQKHLTVRLKGQQDDSELTPILILSSLMVIFIAQNSAVVEFGFLFWDASMSNALRYFSD